MLYEQMDEDGDSFGSFNSKLQLFNDKKEMPKKLTRTYYHKSRGYKSNKSYCENLNEISEEY